MNRYIAFLRGINVSGHHKVPMAELGEELGSLGCKNVITILNSGNVIFDAPEEKIDKLEKRLSSHLNSHFNFPIPVILRKSELIYNLLNRDPFKDIVLTKDMRLYVSFLREEPQVNLKLPWSTEDQSYQILDIFDQTIISVLDLSKTQTTKGMETLEKMFGKDITTRNWNTILRIEKELEEYT